jgi:lipocalin
MSNFDLNAFVAKRWYMQQQMPTSYLPQSESRCVYANYTQLAKKTFWGYGIQVHNYAEDVAPPHTIHDSGDFICAKVVEESSGKLEVAPCFLPSFAAGPYWVVDFNDEEGYALISGGAPSKSAPGGCQTGSGVNDAGLWIFTRQQKRDEALVQKVRGIAAQKGFDLSVLNDVDQVACNQSLVV